MENNNNNNNRPCLGRDSLALSTPLYSLPRNLEKLLPKYDPESFGLPDDHIKTNYPRHKIDECPT
jgi:hypothetical protein